MRKPSGRLRVLGPNLQNIPIESDLGKEIGSKFMRVEKRERIICSQEELIRRLKMFPAEQEFSIHDTEHFTQWCNGHCFYWVWKEGEWVVDEL